MLKQNTGSAAKILTIIPEAQRQYGDSIATVTRNRPAWARLVRRFIPTLKEQPLWSLLVVGTETLDFLYGRGDKDDAIELRPGVADCFRRFYSLILDVVRAAWAKFPADLARNLVLADRTCNGNKRDRMPHVYHLAAWAQRNPAHGDEIVARLSSQITCNLGSTNKVAFWAYAQTESAGGLTWMRADELVALTPAWRTYLQQ